MTIAGRALFGAGRRNQVDAALLPVFSSRFGSTTRVTAPATGFCDTDTLPSAAVVRISEAVRISRAWNSRVGGTTSTRFGRTSGLPCSSFLVDRAWIASCSEARVSGADSGAFPFPALKNWVFRPVRFALKNADAVTVPSVSRAATARFWSMPRNTPSSSFTTISQERPMRSPYFPTENSYSASSRSRAGYSVASATRDRPRAPPRICTSR